ncbi:MAG: glycosyltransferase [Methanoregulaceae archaeon]|nr:glycosyltransferase [Methanoregulaceae archaeon]
MTSIFIGMPVFNGARFIREALDSLVGQSYRDWILLISDNASTDGTEEICREFTAKDARIQYHRQERNVGATSNFKFLLDRAESPYFMWAAADDRWHSNYISTCIRLLAEHPDAGFAFTNLEVINQAGRVIGEVPSFEPFSGSPGTDRIRNFLLDPEINGKACLIYGVYRSDVARRAWEAVPDMAAWGSDYQFVLAALARYGAQIEPKVLFFKRYVEVGNGQYPPPEMIRNPQRYIFPFTKSYRYLRGIMCAARRTPFFWLTVGTMLSRTPRSFLNFILDLANAFPAGEEKSQ